MSMCGSQLLPSPLVAKEGVRFLFTCLSDGRRGRTYKYPGLILTCPESDRALFPFLPFRYGDMRRQIGFEIRDMWYNLGESPRSRPSGDRLPSEVGAALALFISVAASTNVRGLCSLGKNCCSLPELFSGSKSWETK